jgi:predicted O-linked N-acetylglucosamine transferase (SPINDLY family)
VQCHYLGYFATTGLAEMDWWIADANLVPQDAEKLYCERVCRLPRVWVSYVIPEGIPAPVWIDRRDGTVVLGSFNHLGKITERTIGVWARALLEMPQAQLILKTGELEDPANCERIRAAFARRGISAPRLELLGRTPSWTDHMALYNRIDVALDPVGGAAGCTTACEALAMGVPVVAGAGLWHGDRQSASILKAIGHGDWVCSEDDQYLKAVLRLSGDARLRRRLRQELRQDMQRSELGDAKGLAATLEDEFERLFDLWLTAGSSGTRETEIR